MCIRDRSKADACACEVGACASEGDACASERDACVSEAIAWVTEEPTDRTVRVAEKDDRGSA